MNIVRLLAINMPLHFLVAPAHVYPVNKASEISDRKTMRNGCEETVFTLLFGPVKEAIPSPVVVQLHIIVQSGSKLPFPLFLEMRCLEMGIGLI